MPFLKCMPQVLNVLCPMSSEDWNARPLSILIWSAAGAMVAAECFYIAAIHLSHPRVAAFSTDGSKSNEVKVAEGTALNYWIHLSDAICAAPQTALVGIGEAAGIDSKVPDAAPVAVRRLWNGEADYSIASREVLNALQGDRYPGLGDGATACASLAVLWRLHCVRSIYTAVSRFGDAERCRDELEMLQTHTSRIFKSFIRPLVKSGKEEEEALAVCWEELSAALKQLLRRRRALQVRNLWTLAKYLCAGTADRILEIGLSVACTILALRNEAYGTRVRKHIVNLIEANFRGRNLKRDCQQYTTAEHCIGEQIDSTCGSSGGNIECGSGIDTAEACPNVILGLLVFELARLAATAAITGLLTSGIRFAVTRHREQTKEKLYNALARTPMSYFDTHDMDEVEEMLCYPNDLEGLDMRVQIFLVKTIQTVFSFFSFGRRNCAMASVTVFTTSLLMGFISFLREHYGNDLDEGYDDGDGGAMSDSLCDAEEAENGTLAGDGVMLRGMEIITCVHELRPYAADVKLMSEWNAQQRRRRSRRHARVVCRSFRRTFRPRRLWALEATSSLIEWLVPEVVGAYSRANFEGIVTLTDATRETRNVMEAVREWWQLAEIIMYNAHKAGVLERVLDSRHWERVKVKSEVEALEKLTDDHNGNEDDNDDDDDDDGDDDDMNNLTNDVQLCGIRAVGIQFRYPSAPSVDVYRIPLSFSAELRGRFVCFSGASGYGKTTTLRLLLGLYDLQEGELMMRLQQRGSSDEAWVSVASIPHRALRRRVFSYVPQDPMLIHGASFAQNVSMRSRVSVADAAVLRRVRDCAEAAGCGEFVERLPRGLLTPLAGAARWTPAGAVRLSSGQARRVMLARALFHGGGVLLMDEPTAGLDEAARGALMERWRALLREGRVRGVLCVTHDGALMQEADEVIQL